MSTTIEIATGEAANPAPQDRRRPGRIDNVPLPLVSLLRSPHAAGIDLDLVKLEEIRPSDGRRDSLSAARGLAFALALAFAFWALVAVGAWWL